MAESVVVSCEGELVVLTLDRPPLNLFDDSMIEELYQVVISLTADAPRALLIRAEGKVVSAGIDVKVFDGLGRAGATDLLSRLMTITHSIERLPCPVVFAAHGLTLTAAFEIALACDMILAAEVATFGLVEAKLGITPGMGGTQRLAQRAGHGHARECVMTGDIFSAQELREWGAVDRVLPVEGFDATARQLALRLATGPTQAHAATKRILHGYLTGGLPEADRITTGAVASLYDTKDVKDSVFAFLSGRPYLMEFSGE